MKFFNKKINNEAKENGSDDASLKGWAHCTDIESGETFYLDRSTGEICDEIPVLTCSQESLETDITKSQKSDSSGIISLDTILAELNRAKLLMENLSMNTSRVHSDLLPGEFTDKLESVIQSMNDTLSIAEEIWKTNGASLESVMDSSHENVNLSSYESKVYRSKIIEAFEMTETDADMSQDDPNYSKSSSTRSLIQVDQCDSMELKLVHSMDPFPRIFSDVPLFLEKSNVQCSVFLPTEYFHGALSIGVLVQTTDTADYILQKITRTTTLRGLRNDSADGLDFMLKARGSEEYFYGDGHVISYRLFRDKINRDESIELVLVCKQALEEEHSRLNQNCKNLYSLDDYMQSIDRSVKTGHYTLLKNESVPQHQSITSYESIGAKEFKLSIVSANLPEMGELSHLTKIDNNELIGYSVITIFAHGTSLLYDGPLHTTTIPVTSTPTWNQAISPTFKGKPVCYESIPWETRACFILCAEYACVNKDSYSTIALTKRFPLCWGHSSVIDSNGLLKQQKHDLELYRIPLNISREAIPSQETHQKDTYDTWEFVLQMNIGSACSKHSAKSQSRLSLKIQYDQVFSGDVVRAPPEIEAEYHQQDTTRDMSPSIANLPVSDILSKSLLQQLNDCEKQCLWITRHNLLNDPQALPRFLSSVDWYDPKKRCETYRLLKQWKPLENPITIISLLGAEYADTMVRKYAVERLRSVSDTMLKELLPQLVQVIRFDHSDYSDLVQFLLERSLKSPIVIGNDLFWLIKFEMQRGIFAERYSMIMESLLLLLGPYATELSNQFELVQKLQGVAEMVASLSRKGQESSEVVKLYHRQLEQINDVVMLRIQSVRNPLNPLVKFGRLKVSKCRYMSSKMAPLWLVFENSDPAGEDINIILKVGDDIRQDVMTIQHLRLLERLWWSQGINLRLSPYSCVATGLSSGGRGVGLIEVVNKAETTSRIHWEFGGRFGAFSAQTLSNFLRQHNPGESSYSLAERNFSKSCAGYCVASYVLGLGDRHNGNIMLKKDGHMFHIDFGHFLGNFKSKAGFKREREAFVFTPEMAFIISGKSKFHAGNPKTSAFLEDCSQAYELMRAHSNDWIILFKLMVSSGIPELMKMSEIGYMYDRLMPNKSKEDANKVLYAEIHRSLNTKFRRFDNLIHCWVHES